MENVAKTIYPVNDLIRRRWSPRAFENRPVEKEKLRQILEAARWAPSSYNEQPWTYIVATRHEPEEYDTLLACLVERNQRWAKAAPVLMISLGRRFFSQSGKPNLTWQHDVGLGSENLCLQATDLGLATHQMAGIDRDKIRKTYRIPDDVEPVAAIAVGYPGDPATLPEEFKSSEAAPRSRHPLSEFIFSKTWGRPSSVLS